MFQTIIETVENKRYIKQPLYRVSRKKCRWEHRVDFTKNLAAWKDVEKVSSCRLY